MQERINFILNKFSGVKSSGENKWQALCPCHDDHNPSLTICFTDDRILLHCFAGCQTEEILEKAGLTMKDLFLNEYSSKQIEATYDYTDEDGALLYQVVRFNPKGFAIRRPAGNGEWVWNLGKSRKVLYHLPDILRAIDAQEAIYITEGEKACDNLWEKGVSENIVATTSPFGAGHWSSEYSRVLAGAKEIIILPDNDEPGKKHAQDILQSLLGKVGSLKVLKLPEDIDDWIDKHKPRELTELVASLPEARLAKEYHRTDMGNAERLVDEYGKILRHCYEWDKWLIWDTRRWFKDSGEGIVQKAKETVRNIYIEASESEDEEKRKELVRFALSSEQGFRIKQMIDLAKSEVAVKPEALDSNNWLLNCRNGTINLRTGEIFAHDRENLITRLVNADYQSWATCKLWLKFLNEIMDGNQSLMDFIQKALGYSLTGDVSERCIFILYGSGANGKSTLLSVLGELLNDYALQTPTQTLMMKYYSGIPNDIARLKGARFVTAAESEMNQRLNEGLIKQLAGGDIVSARFMRGEFFDFMPTHKLWLATNHKPIIRGTDKAIWDRIRLIPFNVAIPEERQDKHLVDKLIVEAPGILKWAVEGCLEWQKGGLGTPEEVKEATNQYRNEMDILANWLEECCLVGEKYTASAKSLYQGYQSWCERNGERAFSQRQFGLSLGERGFEKFKDRWGIKYLGIGIKEESGE